ncbi:MAG: DNA-directed RNA polymerase subunit omega [Chthoniobacterales bacterium]
MNPTLLKNAVARVPETELLINMVRLRVRQLIRGQRALVVTPPGMGFSDIALSEIGEGKLSYEVSLGPVTESAAPVIAFPKTTTSDRKAA